MVYFAHTKDNTKAHTNVQAHTMAGIVIGWSDTSNGLLAYKHITKELYTTSVYKIDEHHNATKTYINLQYDGGGGVLWYVFDRFSPKYPQRLSNWDLSYYCIQHI